MGEDITETFEVVPRQWKVIQTVRENFTNFTDRCIECLYELLADIRTWKGGASGS